MSRFFIAMLLLPTAGLAAALGPCTRPVDEPVIEGNLLRTRFVDSCGTPYEVGYRLMGNALIFPLGGEHRLGGLPEAEAQSVLRGTYGLVEGRAGWMIRTKDVQD